MLPKFHAYVEGFQLLDDSKIDELIATTKKQLPNNHDDGEISLDNYVIHWEYWNEDCLKMHDSSNYEEEINTRIKHHITYDGPLKAGLSYVTHRFENCRNKYGDDTRSFTIYRKTYVENMTASGLASYGPNPPDPLPGTLGGKEQGDNYNRGDARPCSTKPKRNTNLNRRSAHSQISRKKKKRPKH